MSQFLGNQFTVEKKECIYPGCPLLINTILHAGNKRYCEFHVKLRVKENWTRCNHNNSQNLRKPVMFPLLYLLKTNKVVSKWQVLAWYKFKKDFSLFNAMWILRKQGHKIRFKSGFYFYEGKK